MDAAVASPVSVLLNGEIPREQALESIEQSLLNSGYDLVEVGENFLVVAGLGKNPRQFALVYTRLDQLPKGERIVTRAIQLKHRPVVDCAQFIQMYMVPSSNGSSQCVPIPVSEGLLFTELTSVVRKSGTVDRTFRRP